MVKKKTQSPIFPYPLSQLLPDTIIQQFEDYRALFDDMFKPLLALDLELNLEQPLEEKVSFSETP